MAQELIPTQLGDKNNNPIAPITSAEVTLYNNMTSGLGAANVQEAIDALKVLVDQLQAQINSLHATE